MDSQEIIVCPNCAAQLPADSVFCMKCGAKAGGEPICVPLTDVPALGHDRPKYKKIILAITFVVIVLVAISIIISTVGASVLKNELKRDWSEIEVSEGAYIEKILDFSDNEVEYRLETGYAWLDTSLGTYDYKIVDRNTIKIKRFDEYETYKVEFTDDKAMMIITPAITSVDDYEYWYNFD